MTKQFIVVFQAYDSYGANAVITVQAEHVDDIDVWSVGDNLDPSAHNSADWHIRSRDSGEVLRCSPVAHYSVAP